MGESRLRVYYMSFAEEIDDIDSRQRYTSQWDVNKSYYLAVDRKEVHHLLDYTAEELIKAYADCYIG